MNRAQRRKLEKSKSQKPNRSRLKMTNYFTLEFDTFDSIERLFQQLRNGALLYSQKDGWQIMGLSGEMLHIESALEGWLKYWKELTEQNNIPYDDAPLVRILKALEYVKPLSRREIDAAYKVVELQRHLYRTVPKAETTRVVREVQKDIRRTDEIRELMGIAA
ncbi:MAG: hypothetical protein WC009_11360 [Methylotenera sp.]